jgi:hypothetical protein
MRISNLSVGCLSISWLLATSAEAATLVVPTSYGTIQAAINTAVDGDTVLVLPGTSNETIEFNGKEIEVRSGLPFAATIDAGFSGSAVKIGGNVGPDAKLVGFYIRNGDAAEGGGVLINGSPTIQTCYFEDCSAGAGGGIHAVGDPSILQCYFIECSATLGGALSLEGDAKLEDCAFVGNSASVGGAIRSAGGLTIDRCDFADCTATIGSSLAVESGTALVNAVGMYGTTGETIDVTGNLVIVNSILDGGERAIRASSLTGAVLLSVINCTISGQSLESLELIGTDFPLLAAVSNSIIWSTPLAIDAQDLTLTLTVNRSNIQGGWPGLGNLDVDPQFTGDLVAPFSLRATSPCIDAGSNVLVPPTILTDYWGDNRFADHPAVADLGVSGSSGGAKIVDMGAYESEPLVRYVNHAATGSNNGLSWANAFTDLQDALQVGAGDDGTYIFVAKGTYRPDRGTNDRTMSFTLPAGVGIFGGFAGGETALSEADLLAHPTILSGDIGGFATSDNAYHVVTLIDGDDATTVDGFLVQCGFASGTGANEDRGGGIFVDGGVAGEAPKIRRCWVRLNEATGNGGALFATNASPNISGCRFNLNVSQASGSAIAFAGGEPTLVNSLVHGNDAKENGAVRIVDFADATLVNVTVADNVSQTDVCGGVSVGPEGTLTLRNALLWLNQGVGGTTEQHQIRVTGSADIGGSSVEGWSGGLRGLLNNGNDPLFVDPFGVDNIAGTGDDNYRLTSLSPAIDNAMSTLLPEASYPTDLDGLDRFVDDPSSPNLGTGPVPFLDRGAYEFVGTPCPTDLNGDAQTNAPDLALLLGAWGGSGLGDVDGSGVVDASDLAVLLGAWGPC